MSYRWFQNTDCEYFPCHKCVLSSSREKFSCLFCFCPLYSDSACGGNYKILDNGLKDCSACTIPHFNYDYIINKIIKNASEAKKMELLVKYHADIEELQQVEGSDWIDLRAAEDVTMEPGDFKLISLGVSIKLPEGYEAHVVPRSSTFKNFGVIQSNHMGLIDESYCGDSDIWRFPAYALRHTEIHKNDRICQFRIMKKQPKIEFKIVDKMLDKDRGGLGSTGIK